MSQQQYRNNNALVQSSSVHNQNTDPMMRSVMAPIAAPFVIRETRGQRFQRGVKNFFAAVFRKLNQLIGLGLVVLLLLLGTRFLLNFFEITTSVFTDWIHLLTAPLVYPFENLAPAIPWNGFSIDVTTLIAIVVWTVAIVIVRQFIHLLAGRW